MTAQPHLRLLPPARPTTRGDCLPGGHNAARPCQFTSCKWHMTTAITSEDPRGTRNLADFAMTETCILDVADRGGATHDEIGRCMGVKRSRIQQIEARALKRLGVRLGLLAFAGHDCGQTQTPLAAAIDSNSRAGEETDDWNLRPLEVMTVWLHIDRDEVTDDMVARAYDPRDEAHAEYRGEPKYEYAVAVNDVYERASRNGPWKPPCPTYGCKLDAGHTSECDLPRSRSKERRRK